MSTCCCTQLYRVMCVTNSPFDPFVGWERHLWWTSTFRFLSVKFKVNNFLLHFGFLLTAYSSSILTLGMWIASLATNTRPQLELISWQKKFSLRIGCTHYRLVSRLRSIWRKLFSVLFCSMKLLCPLLLAP